jgi:hypothetical protein
MEFASSLKTLKTDTPWDLKKVSQLIIEIAVNSKDFSVDSLLPVVFSVLDSAKQTALLKLVQEVSLNASASAEVTKMFDELKVVAKFAAPAVLKSLTLRKVLSVFSSCCSGVSVLKAIDQKESDAKVEEEVKEEVKEENKVEENKVEENKVEEKVVEEKKKEVKKEEVKKSA